MKRDYFSVRVQANYTTISFSGAFLDSACYVKKAPIAIGDFVGKHTIKNIDTKM